MNSFVKTQILKVAKPLRKALEELRSYPKNCAGLCAIAAAELHRRLNKVGIPSMIAVWNGDDEGHCYLIVDKMVVDITATQFEGFENDKIFIKPHAQAKFANYWKVNKKFSTIESFRDYLLETGWCMEQLPHLESTFKNGYYLMK